MAFLPAHQPNVLGFKSMTNESWNYYEVLEVPKDATQDTIYSAYQQAKQTYSLSNPKIFSIFSESEAIHWLNMIEEAYSVIGHPNTRRVYDIEQKLTHPQASNCTDKTAEQSENDAAELPEGFARTQHSQYQINKNMEDLIEKQELFDGLFLKKIREYKNIDLTEFSKHTCIAIRHLYAIENNNFSVLPAAVFVRGYIIQYCRLLGLDQKKVVSSFMSLLQND